MVAVELEGQVQLAVLGAAAPCPNVHVPTRLGRPPRVFFGAPPPRWLAAIETGEDEWTIQRTDAPPEIWRTVPGREVLGLLEKEWSPPKPALAFVDAGRKTLGLFRPDGWEPVVVSETRIAHAAASSVARDVAYVTERGDLAVYSVYSKGVVARVTRSGR